MANYFPAAAAAVKPIDMPSYSDFLQQRDAYRTQQNALAQQQLNQQQTVQTMQMRQAEEARKAALAAPQLAEATTKAQSERAKFVVTAIGRALHTSVNDPTDETLDQAVATLAGVGLRPEEIEREITPIKQLPLEQRKSALMRTILSDPNTKAAYEATLPKLVQVRRGDRIDQLDENPLSSTFNQVVRSDMVGVSPNTVFNKTMRGAAPARVSGGGGGGGVPSGRGGAAPAAGGGGGGGGGVAPAAGGGKGAAKKTTEDERKISSNVRNMVSAVKDLAAEVQADPSSMAPGTAEYVASGVGEEAARFAQSGPRQRFNTAMEKMLAAVTFINTGAGVSKEQMNSYRKSYFPTYQDTPRTRQSKLLGAVQFIRDAKSRAGNAWTPDLDAALNQLQATLGRKATYEGKKAAAPAAKSGLPDDVRKKYGL